MIDRKNESKQLASLAVFRELYKKEKDVYGVISEFLLQTIVSHSLTNFSLTEITNLVNSTFDFQIIDSVVKTSIGRLDFITKDQGKYIVKHSVIKSHGLDEIQTEIKSSNDHIIESLINYIEKEKGSKLNEAEEENVIHCFCSYLLDEANGDDFSLQISSFIIEQKSDYEFTKRLAQIREGVVLYSGLKYNQSLNEQGAWKTDLTIFLETEMLFHFAGYNGTVFQSLFNDFYKFVKEINNAAGKKLIKLRYFSEVKSEIESFFTKAKYLKKDGGKVHPDATAMNSIVNGCSDIGEILEKKADFYTLLQTNGILEEIHEDYFTRENYQYNVIDGSTIENLSKELDTDISENLRFINYVSLKRKEKNYNNFENIGYILLSGNRNTIKVAWHSDVKNEGDVPLATTLHWLTNRFWFRLNKGFGNNKFPKSFDIITKAQISLSNDLNNSIGIKYKELQAKVRSGDLTEEQIKARIIHLRNSTRKPEEIEKDNISTVLDVITEDSLDRFVEEQDSIKLSAAQKHSENLVLKSQINEKEANLSTEIQEKEQLKKQIAIDLLKSLKEKITDKENQLSKTNQLKALYDEESKSQLFKFKLFIGFVFISYYVLTFFLIWKLGWNYMEQWTYVINVCVPLIITVLISLFTNGSLNIRKLLEKKQLQIKNQIYNKYSFKESEVRDLETEISSLKEEIHNNTYGQ